MKHTLVLVLFMFCLSNVPLFAQSYRDDTARYGKFDQGYSSNLNPSRSKTHAKSNFTPKRTKEYLKSSTQKKTCRKSKKINTVNYYHDKKGFISWLLEVDRKFREKCW